MIKKISMRLSKKAHNKLNKIRKKIGMPIEKYNDKPMEALFG